MRFNLNRKTSLLFGYTQAKEVTEQARFYTEACLAFCREHDIDYHAESHTFLNSPSGAETMSAWLGSKGWRVTAWIFNREIEEPLAWGLNFDDDCPRFVEAKLKGWRYIE